MRHFMANIAIYLIALFLLGAAALFGWTRAAQLVITGEEAVLARFGPAPAYEFRWEELGERAYRRNCENCHGPEGRGWDQYPGLSHTARLFQAPGGHDYVADLHLYGLTSERWGAPMPPMGHMHDIELAAVINHVLTNFGNEQVLDETAALYRPQDIEQRRGLNLTPREVDGQRGAVVGGGGGE
jgi:mono/diheme cytochrome c family protein